MDLNELRQNINQVDEQLQQLFDKRMELCFKVAEYKIKNDLPVFQPEREKQVLDRVSANAPEELKGATRVFYRNLMDISKCLQYRKFFADSTKMEYEPLDLSGTHTVAVPGISGSYNHIACSNLFDSFTPVFREKFEDIFRAVDSGEAEFGILPIANSTAGTVGQTYELMRRHDFRIVAATKLRIEHCLASRPDVKLEDVVSVYSHEQGLHQCSEFLESLGCRTHSYANTSLAAEFVSRSSRPIAAICSRDAAQRLGLSILKTDIANAKDNYTKFILISKRCLKSEGADTIAVSLALPHQSSSLYRLLTKFSVAGLNLTMIESMPIANTDFDVLFYLNFHGSIDDPDVVKLISELEDELSYFKFLGNFKEV